MSSRRSTWPSCVPTSRPGRLRQRRPASPRADDASPTARRRPGRAYGRRRRRVPGPALAAGRVVDASNRVRVPSRRSSSPVTRDAPPSPRDLEEQPVRDARSRARRRDDRAHVGAATPHVTVRAGCGGAGRVGDRGEAARRCVPSLRGARPARSRSAARIGRAASRVNVAVGRRSSRTGRPVEPRRARSTRRRPCRACEPEATDRPRHAAVRDRRPAGRRGRRGRVHRRRAAVRGVAGAATAGGGGARGAARRRARRRRRAPSRRARRARARRAIIAASWT